MANNEEEQVEHALTARRLLVGARMAVQRIGAGPAPWVYALIEELAYVSINQRQSDASIEDAVNLFTSMLRTSMEEQTANPRIGDESAVTVKIIHLAETGALGPEPRGDDVDDIIKRAIERGAKQS